MRFAAFVEWPQRSFATSRSPVVICVVGRDPFRGALDRAARAQTAYGRPLAVRRPDTAEATAGCHILYVGQGGGRLAPDGVRPILLVTDAAVSSGRGMIHFVIDDERVRFDYMPRGVYEAFNEQRMNAVHKLVVEPTIFLHYEVPFYFFVSRSNVALGQRVERGLRIALKDGSFDKLFNSFPAFQRSQAEIRAGKRLVFELKTL